MNNQKQDESNKQHLPFNISLSLSNNSVERSQSEQTVDNPGSKSKSPNAERTKGKP